MEDWEVGYLANTVAGDKVLEGTYNYSEGFHPATKELLAEYARIRASVPEKSANNFLGSREWQRRWPWAKEKTSSSVSKLHFGHYMAGAKSNRISYVHALKTSMSLKYGVPLVGWLVVSQSC